MAKNITLAIDEKLLEHARAYAARRGMTLNALVRQQLADVVAEDERIAEAKRGLRELIERSTAELGPDYKWNREELYAERLFPRHEHTDLRRGRKKRTSGKASDRQ